MTQYNNSNDLIDELEILRTTIAPSERDQLLTNVTSQMIYDLTRPCSFHHHTSNNTLIDWIHNSTYEMDKKKLNKLLSDIIRTMRNMRFEAEENNFTFFNIGIENPVPLETIEAMCRQGIPESPSAPTNISDSGEDDMENIVHHYQSLQYHAILLHLVKSYHSDNRASMVNQFKRMEKDLAKLLCKMEILMNHFNVTKLDDIEMIHELYITNANCVLIFFSDYMEIILRIENFFHELQGR